MIRRELFIFLIVGTLTVLVDFLIYSGLIWIELADINIAKAGGFIAGTIFAYLANRFWTFSHKQYESGSLWRFGIVYTFTLCVNVLANSFVLTLLIDYNAAFQIASEVEYSGRVENRSRSAMNPSNWIPVETNTILIVSRARPPNWSTCKLPFSSTRWDSVSRCPMSISKKVAIVMKLNPPINIRARMNIWPVRVQ